MYEQVQPCCGGELGVCSSLSFINRVFPWTLSTDVGCRGGQRPDAGGDLARRRSWSSARRLAPPRRACRRSFPWLRGFRRRRRQCGFWGKEGLCRRQMHANSAKTALEQGTTRQRCRPFHQRGFPNVLAQGTVGVAAVCGFHRPDRCGAQETRGFSCSQALRRSSQAHQDEVKEADDIS